MKNLIHQAKKGFATLLVIKLLLIVISFSVHSCQKDDNIFIESNQETALKDFQSTLEKVLPEIEHLKKSKNKYYSNFQKSNPIEIPDEDDLNVGNEIEAKNVLLPLVISSKDLLQTYNITQTDLQMNGLIGDDPRIALIGLTVLYIEEEYENETAFNLINEFFPTVRAQSWSKIGGCAKRALGLDIIDDFKNLKGLKNKARKRAVNKIIKKALGTVAAKYVGGWFGAAVVVGEFAICMNVSRDGGADGSIGTVSLTYKDFICIGLKNNSRTSVMLKKVDVNYQPNGEVLINDYDMYHTFYYNCGDINDINSKCFIDYAGLEKDVYGIELDLNNIKEVRNPNPNPNPNPGPNPGPFPGGLVPGL